MREDKIEFGARLTRVRYAFEDDDEWQAVHGCHVGYGNTRTHRD
ncbi:MAG TPA: hypothetical protein VF970_09020 [Gemmatimonadales bacterium]